MNTNIVWILGYEKLSFNQLVMGSPTFTLGNTGTINKDN